MAQWPLFCFISDLGASYVKMIEVMTWQQNSYSDKLKQKPLSKRSSHRIHQISPARATVWPRQHTLRTSAKTSLSVSSCQHHCINMITVRVTCCEPCKRRGKLQRSSALRTVASLGLVSPGAATYGVTPIFFPEKPDDLF